MMPPTTKTTTKNNYNINVKIYAAVITAQPLPD